MDGNAGGFVRTWKALGGVMSQVCSRCHVAAAVVVGMLLCGFPLIQPALQVTPPPTHTHTQQSTAIVSAW